MAIVEIEKGVWLAPWEGDPGRTLCKDFAKKFRDCVEAEKAINEAREYHPFLKAKIFTA